jgi:hypothetical protein
MRTLKIDEKTCPAELKQGLAEIRAMRPSAFRPGPKALNVRFEKIEGAAGRQLSVSRSGAGAVVKYAQKPDAFRALGRLLGESDTDTGNFSETPRFDLLGVMVDCSRNGVLRPDAAKAFLRHLALMGMNMCILYCEDTYEVPGEPFFGYLRGRYTYDELRDLDQYADALGIEMFPCIQTLGHLEQILQWPAYSDYRDVNGVLLADEDRTYALLEKMITAAAAPFRSKRIHIGMDEAHGIGTGRYKERHGEKSPFDVLNSHLKHVRELCGKLGLRPMIWSDMYFRLGSKRHEYYDKETVIPAEVVRDIPKDVELVYWDYYHTDQAFYEDWIERHRQLGSEPLMAGGVWTWGRLWCHLPFSITTTEACLQACKAKKLRQAFATLWGDDGMECNVFSALAGLQFFAEHGYADAVDQKLLRANFRGSCDADYDDWAKSSELDAVPLLEDPGKTTATPAKWLLWQDPFLSIMDPQLHGKSLRSHYEGLAKAMTAAAKKSAGAKILSLAAQFARVLALKCDLRKDLAAAYKAKNKRKLKQIVTGDLAKLRKEANKLWHAHRQAWLETYKPFGLEVLEQRYGFLMTRLETMNDRLNDYLKGKVPAIPELEAKLELIHDLKEGQLPGGNYHRVQTPSTIK